MKSLGWELLDAMEKEGCPVCRVVERGLRRFYFWFLNQNYYEGNVIEEMKASYGFCNPHAWPLVEKGDPYVVAVVERYLVEEARSRIQDYLRRTEAHPLRRATKLLRELRKILWPRGKCPACRYVEEATRSNLAWLIDGLDEPQYKELYKRSHGLCLEHLLQAIEIGPPEVVKELLEDQAERLTALEWELNEFIRKHNYIYAHEPKGEEQTSWIRAMERLVGSSKRLK